LGSTITHLIPLTGGARFPSSGGGAVPGLPKPRSNIAFAADRRVPAATSASFMSSTITWIAASPWSRASSLMSSGKSVSSVIMKRKVVDLVERFNSVEAVARNNKAA
jgi:hypothetical protein